MTPKVRHDNIKQKGGVIYMTNDTARFTLRLPSELKERLTERSEKMGISLNSLVIQLLWQWLDERSQA